MDDFCIFILSHGRSDNVVTYKTLEKAGYTGKIIIVIDDEDDSADDYYELFDDVEMFDKKEIAKTFDEADNFNDRRSPVYARNACFEIAEKRGFKYFVQMDDDYSSFQYRVYRADRQKPSVINNLDAVLEAFLNFFKKTNFMSIAMAQGGDFIGGKNNKMAKKPTIYRKCMNSFFCSTERPFTFVGVLNDDVNTYISRGSRGQLFGTIPMVSLTQNQTQKTSGGITEKYLDQGTYVKSFYTVLFAPSSCTVRMMGNTNKRLHHSISWNNAVPKIVSETHN